MSRAEFRRGFTESGDKIIVEEQLKSSRTGGTEVEDKVGKFARFECRSASRSTKIY